MVTRPRRWAVTTAACIAVMGMVTACGGSGSTSSAADTSEPSGQTQGATTDVTILYSRAAEQVGLWVAEDKGFFEKNGLNVTLQETDNAGQVAVAISGNSAQMGYETAPDFLTASAKGVDLVVVSGLSVDTAENARVAVFATKDSGIATAADLAGKRIAVPGVGTSSQVSTSNLISQAGADPSGIQWVPMPFQNEADALKAGRVDAAVAVHPFISQLRAAGHTEVIDTFAKGDERQIVVLLSGSGSWVAEHPEATLAVRKSIDEANDYVAENPDDARAVIEKYSGLPPEIVKAIPLPNLDSTVTVDQLTFFEDMLINQKILEQRADLSKLVVGGND